MCDCFHIAFPNWHAASSGAGAGRRLRGPEPGTEDNSICDEASQFTEGERPRPQGSSPVDEFPESDKYGESDKECEAEHDPYQKSGKKLKKSGLGSIFDKRSTPKMSKLKEAPSPEAGVIVKTAKDGGAEGLVYSGGGKDGIFIKEVVPESPASKNLHLKEGDQVLSATVYFDNIPYEDAIQILEHAQAYKVKLCLKRKPETTETEGIIESDAIPEDEVHPPDMREPGKKRRGDARISWPKFPTLGRGKKSRFTRSHSSSEADEQRKLELSPTTSDTESPIKSQDALKGKKKHKIKLPGLKRGRISSSEDTDAQNIQTEDMISPECLESPSRETQDMEDELKKDEKVEKDETETHKVELVCLDSTLKTTDITEALVEQETPSTTASPDGKKKKKERSELKLKILGKDKKHKAKSSPKRLKTLGASLDKTDDKEKSDVLASGKKDDLTREAEVPKMSSSKSSQMELRLPKVEIDISDVGIICKSTHDKKGKVTEEKPFKTGFKLPKVGLCDVPTEEIIRIDPSVEESKVKVKNDAYDRLSKGTELPKREDIEIPGMEDLSKMTKDFKEPKAPLATITDAELQAETVQLSIDVDSVKEAVSKLPGYKLPKVDMSGVPIPEEITVIDANAQRISVKTPTKGKHESKSPFTEISKTTVKLPNVSADVTGGEIISETKVGGKKLEFEDITISTRAIISQTVEVEKVQKESITFTSGSVETPKELDIKIKTPKVTLPDVSVAKPGVKIQDLKIHQTKSSEKKEEKVQGERTIFLPEDKFDVKLPDVKTSSIKGEFEIPCKDIGVTLKVTGEEQKGISVGGIEPKSPEKQDKGGKFKMPNVGISMPKVKGIKVDVDVPNVEVDQPKLENKSQKTESDKDSKYSINLKGPEIGLSKEVIDISLPTAKVEVGGPTIPESTGELDGQDVKFKLPKLGLKMPKIKGPEMDVNKDLEITLPDVKAKMDLPEVPAVDVTIGEIEVSMPEKKVELEVKSPTIEGDIEGKGGKLKMPKLGVKLPKVKGPEFDISLSKKDGEGKLPKVKVEMQLPEAPDISSPEKKIPKTEIDFDGQGGKFKMPKLGITMPKMKGPEIDFSQLKKDKDLKAEVKMPEVDITVGKVNIPDAKIEVAKPNVEIKPLDVKLDIKAPEVKLKETDAELEGQSGKFKIPRFTIAIPKVKASEGDSSSEQKDVDVTLPVAKIEVEQVDVKVKPPEIDADLEGQSGKFKLPKFGIKMQKVKGTEIDISLPKKEVKSPEIKGDIKLPEVPKVDVNFGELDVKIPDAKVEIKKPDIPNLEVKPPSGKIKIKPPDIDVSVTEDSPSKFKLPSLGFSVPKKDVNVTLPETKIEGKQPEVESTIEVKEPDVEVSAKGSPLKFKMPSFKLPKFGGSIEEKDSEIKIEGADVTVTVPQVNVDLPDVKAEIHRPETDVKASLGELEIEQPSGLELDAKFKKPRFSLPRFSFSKQSVSGPEVNIDVPDMKIPQTEGKVEVKGDVKAPELEVAVDSQGSKFKLPKFGITMPKISAPEIDLSLSKKEVEVTLPEVTVEGKLPDVDIKAPSLEAEIKAPEITVESKTKEGSPSKLKMPTFKLPKFGATIPEAEIKIDGTKDLKVDLTLPEVKAEAHAPDVDIEAPSIELEIEKPSGLEMDAKFKKPRFSLPRFSFSKQSVPAPEIDISAPEVNIPQTEGKVEVKGEVDIKAPELEATVDGQGSKFKLPKFGITMPKISAPEIDLSLSKKDVEVTLPEAKVEGKLPDVELKAPSVEVEFTAPEIKVETKTKEGSPSKLKMPTFKLPKFGASIPEAELKVDGAQVTVPEVDVDLPDVEAKVKLPEAEINVPSGEVVIEQPSGLELDAKFKKPRFSLPRFSFSKQSVPAPDVDIDAPEVKISQTEGQVEVKGDVNVKAPELEVAVDGQGSKFKLPKFGITMPKISAPEIDLSLSKKEVEVTLPEVTVEGKLPDVDIKAPSGEAEIKAPEITVESKTKEGSPSKIKMPTFKLPKFGATIPEAEIKIDGTKDLKVDLTLPEVKAEAHAPDVDIEAPSIELEIEKPSGLEMDAKFKKPRFSLPRFSFSKQSVPAPEIDISAPEVNIPQTEGKVEMKGEVDIKAPELEATVDGQGSKFKLPKFGITMPKISAPEIDLSLSKKDVEVTLPEAKVEGKLPDVDVKAPSVEVEFTAPEIKVETKTKEGSPSKLKMPTFKLPKFGASIPEAELKVDGAQVTVPEVDVDLPDVEAKVKLPEAEINVPSGEVVIEQPSGLELDAKFKKPRFSLPRFSFSKQSVPAPEVDVSSPEVNIPQTEGKVEVKGDVKAPELEAQADGQGSKFKLPKFGITMPKISAPDIDLSLSKKEVEVTLPEVNVEGQLPDVEIKAPSIEVEVNAPEIKVETKTKEGSPSKLKMPTFKLPKFGASIPEAEINLDGADITAPKVDVDLPDVKAEVDLPEVEIKAPSGEVVIEQPSGLEMDAKFKKPRFSLPRFSFSKQSVQAPEVDVSAPEVNIPQTEGIMEVKGEIDVKAPELEAHMDGQGSKFKLPKFGITMPKISAPEIDLSLSKKEANIDSKLSDVEVKAPSIEVEVKTPEIKVETKAKEGSPSKLKMPTFKLPKFGGSIPEADIRVDGAEVTGPKIDVDLPNVKAEVNLPEVEVNAPSGEVVIDQPSGLEMDAKFKKPRFSLPRFSFSKQSVPTPEVDNDAPEVKIPEVEKNVDMKGEIDVKSPELDVQVDGQGSKFKFPKFGITMPKISTPEIDVSLSSKNVEETVPESKVEGKLPVVKVRGSSVETEIKLESKQTDGSPSKLKMPSFKMPKFGVTTSSVPADGVEINASIPEEVLIVQADGSSVDVKVSEPEGKRSKFKLPSLGFSTPSTDITHKDEELPEVETKNIPVKVDMKTAEIGESNVEGSPSKFKMPTFKLPKFGTTAEIDGETREGDVKISNEDVKEEKSEVKDSKGSWSLRKISFSKPSVAAPEIDVKLPKVDVSVQETKNEVQSPDKKSSTVEKQQSTEIEVKLKKPRFSLPKISFGKQPSVETEADVNLPEVEMEIKQTDKKPKVEAEVDIEESKLKMPKFGISMPKIKGPEIDLSLSKKDADINSPDAKIETTLPEAEESEISLEAAQKGSSWSFPRFSFSKPAVNVTVESDVDVKDDLKLETTPKHEVKKHSVDEDSPATEPEIKAKFSLPRFSFSKTSAKESTIPENNVAVEVSLVEGEVKIKESKVTQPDIKLSDIDTKDVIVEMKTPENEAKSKGIEGSPLKFKMPVFKMPKVGITTTVSEESSSTRKETEETLQITKEGNTVVITAGSPLMETDVPKALTPDSETPQEDTLGSPSKFKLPSFKMPRLSFSKPKPEDEYIDSKTEENQQEESKSPKKALPSLGEILKNIDVEFDVPKPLEENLGSPGEDQATQKQQEPLKEEKPGSTKSPERTGWFKFPTFGLSSPTDVAKGLKKEDKMDNKSPVDLSGNEDLSPTSSIQSSEAFADISSTLTSENVGFSISSPTKVTVKYSDPDSAALMGEMHSNVVMSTTKTEVISVEPNLPEKVTILSSGLSSSSEDTVKLESGKIHLITSNIQATPESQQAKMLTSIHVQSVEGVSSHETWTVTDSRSSKGTFMESHVVRESSSESKEIVITKQITRVVTTTEPISDETATSIKHLKDSVHTDKMRFFDEAEK